ncbi:MAG TPA: PEP-CTERM sorting domain-containing protein [Bryobacteraceae bacterium]|jgi:hypothetical protein|nr:PEP-CTERM sorting domain-containing protein [Bryobacteraceae bacterium]
MKFGSGLFFIFGSIVALPAGASTLIDFGAGTGITSSYPSGGTTNVPTNGVGIDISGPIVLDGGALEVTASGTLECVAGTTTTKCGDTSDVTNSTAAGLGAGSNRVTVGETITITVQPGYSVSLVSFALDAFTPPEEAFYKINGGTAVDVDALASPALQTTTLGTATAFTTLQFGAVNGNYDLAQLTFNISSTPEPATFGLVGLALAGVGLLRQKRASSVR